MAKNIFIVGPVASGESFFGRKRETEILSETVFEGVGAINLVGPTRIGKSSLVEKIFEENSQCKNRLRVRMVMSDRNDAFSFWSTLAYYVKNELLEAELWNKYFEYKFSEIESLSPAENNWYTIFSTRFGSILEKIGKENYRLILTIDEFDGVVGVFKKDTAHYQFLRSIFSEPKYATSGILISRRRLNLIDASCDNISTFHGVFNEIPLRPFSDKDLEEFYAALKKYCGIELTPEGKKSFVHFTGKMPYLCCMIGERMSHNDKISYGAEDILAIFKKCLPQIDRHYEDLIKRLEEDKQLEFIYYLSLDNALAEISIGEIDNLSGITGRKLETMRQMGILIADEKSDCYHVFSKDFMTYFSTRPLNLPVWETMNLAEKKLKAIFSKVFPLLDSTRYNDFGNTEIQSTLASNYPDLRLNWTRITGYAADLSIHKENPSVLDVLTLSFIIDVMINLWNSHFGIFFAHDSDWKNKLKLIKDIRNPIAHAHIEDINSNFLKNCLRYCDEICHLPV